MPGALTQTHAEARGDREFEPAEYMLGELVEPVRCRVECLVGVQVNRPPGICGDLEQNVGRIGGRGFGGMSTARRGR